MPSLIIPAVAMLLLFAASVAPQAETPRSSSKARTGPTPMAQATPSALQYPNATPTQYLTADDLGVVAWLTHPVIFLLVVGVTYSLLILNVAQLFRSRHNDRAIAEISARLKQIAPVTVAPRANDSLPTANVRRDSGNLNHSSTVAAIERMKSTE
ncbi:MAG TPA: hypothetical protein VNG71_11510 [Pyrinomonadaceae bacterium]|nr:hypothetical protein [Pyrinomonadaceae bacterium]